MAATQTTAQRPFATNRTKWPPPTFAADDSNFACLPIAVEWHCAAAQNLTDQIRVIMWTDHI